MTNATRDVADPNFTIIPSQDTDPSRARPVSISARQRCTRALAPLASRHTSAEVAMEVSPGVVIARAP